jgi:ParB family chromosome partitioning protein
MTAIQMIPIKKIHVINPRARNKAKFADIVTNMSKVGLKKPITVTPREGSGGEFDLVCGQGRLEGFVKLGETHVPAIVTRASTEDCHVMSLVENMARRTPDTLDLVRDIAGLEKRGYSPAQIAGKVDVTEGYVRGILRLHAKGEEILLAAVERGDIPLNVATEIAAAKNDDVKRCLAEAYEKGELKGKAVSKARALVERRLAGGQRNSPRSGRRGPTKKMSVDDVVRTYKRSTQKQAQMVRKAQVCDQLLRLVCGAVRELARDEHFVTLLRAEGLDKMPKYLAEQVRQRGTR